MNNTDKSEIEKLEDILDRLVTFAWSYKHEYPNSDFNQRKELTKYALRDTRILITQQCKDAVDAYHAEITDNEKKVWMYRSDLEKQRNKARIDDIKAWDEFFGKLDPTTPIDIHEWSLKRIAAIESQAKETEES